MNEHVFTLRTERFTIDYLASGEGERAFVILPGMSMKQVTASAAAVEAAFAAFPYRVYLFDQTRETERLGTVRGTAEDIAEAMKLLGIADADIFGASRGGMAALCIAAAHPELVHKLVLGSAQAFSNETARETFTRWAALCRAGEAAALNRDFYPRLFTDGYLETWKDAIAAVPEGTEEELRRFAVMSESCLNFDVREALPQIRCPVLVLGASDDRVLSAEASRFLSEALGCELYIYEDYRHAVYDEAPDYRARMLGFLQRT